jgi:peptide deformylase
MALRRIRIAGDAVLEKKCREVKEMTPRITELIEDMFDTMYEANGVGLAAPQVGVLKRIVVIDCTGEDPICLINPKIVEAEGEQVGEEGCLSLPGKSGIVRRPEKIRVEALNEDMEPFSFEAEGLLARACCHEIDHLEGQMYMDKAEGGVHDVREEEPEGEAES